MEREGASGTWPRRKLLPSTWQKHYHTTTEYSINVAKILEEKHPVLYHMPYRPPNTYSVKHVKNTSVWWSEVNVKLTISYIFPNYRPSLGYLFVSLALSKKGREWVLQSSISQVIWITLKMIQVRARSLENKILGKRNYSFFVIRFLENFSDTKMYVSQEVMLYNLYLKPLK